MAPPQLRRVRRRSLRRDMATVRREMGHNTPAFTLSVYAAAWESSEEEREALVALVDGTYEASNGHEMGNIASGVIDEAVEREVA